MQKAANEDLLHIYGFLKLVIVLPPSRCKSPGKFGPEKQRYQFDQEAIAVSEWRSNPGMTCYSPKSRFGKLSMMF
jgi:hypothetical protein